MITIKKMMSGLLIVFIGTLIYAQEKVPAPVADPAEIASIEQKFAAVRESLSYLEKHNVEKGEVQKLYIEAEELFNKIKPETDAQKYETSRDFLLYKLSILEEKSADRVSNTKSINLIYILLVAFALGIVIIMSIYSGYMYSRRK